ncbi:MAG: MerR family transcriptional regulator [Firmicutes bacterium]|nr:MerR family transcriptional regulator [Bacillota bacterium]NBI63878.1 MerR family transcriptional regulator [Clostridiales bacterium]
MLYTVGEMAKVLGIPASTLRYYDKEGLLPFVERSSGGIRMFTDKDYEWLKVIECLKRSGLSIKDIKTFISERLALSKPKILVKHQIHDHRMAERL